MTGMVTGFRHKLCGFVLAFGLVLGLLVPTLDAFACISDTERSVVTATEDSAKPGEQTLPHKGGMLCVNGHCHLCMSIPKSSERVAANVSEEALEPIVTVHRSPLSAPPNQLLRPPQA